MDCGMHGMLMLISTNFIAFVSSLLRCTHAHEYSLIGASCSANHCIKFNILYILNAYKYKQVKKWNPKKDSLHISDNCKRFVPHAKHIEWHYLFILSFVANFKK